MGRIAPGPTEMTTLTRESDYYSWTMQSASRLRTMGLYEEAEELEEMGRSEAAKLEHQLTRLIAHLLKWKFQPQKRSHSWEASILDSVHRARRHLSKNPGLKSELDELLQAAHESASYRASTEADLPVKTFKLGQPW